ncbi:class F sortase [Streptomyces sioyaensis]|uniref:class F sortase n=1 Tax=Streptomyces sioyaensis TaxID=67364 RepID=UPI0037AE5F9F
MPRWKILSAVLASLVIIALGLVLIARPRQDAAAGSAVPLPATPFSVDPSRLPGAPPPSATGQQVPPGRGGRDCDRTLRASHIVIPALCVNAPVVATSRIRDGALSIPEDVQRVGMWDQGAALTDKAGTTLLAGHVHAPVQGNGALYDLYRSRPGDAVYASDSRGTVTAWRIAGLQAAPKSRLPGSVFAGKSGPRRLILVTCGGPVEFHPGYGNVYRDNVIVTAVRN